MTATVEDWWRDQIPDGEKILWFGRPDQGFFPPRYGWAYVAGFLGLIVLWLSSPWLFDTVREFWKLTCVTLLIAFALWADRFVRAQRVYVVTTQNARIINEIFKPKILKIDKSLKYFFSRRRLTFSRGLFFSFDHLSDPDAALKALNQAREAST
ncbi:hypothetical protein RA27_14810 [Ruegeria sp. ANG-R]|nr:hypothetical protein RA27_14810 [Ruegeria sp. ANG-R]